jgi:hypothetical protein
MENVPRYGASRSDHRWSDRESTADHARPEDVSLLKLAQIISRDEAFLAIGRDPTWRYAAFAEEALGSASDPETAEYDQPEYDLSEYDLPEFDAGDPIADASQGWSPQAAPSNPGRLESDDRHASQAQAARAPHVTSHDESTVLPQSGHALSELARLVGRIDSFLAAGSTPTEPLERTPGGQLAANDGDDDEALDDEAPDVQMPVPSRHDRLTNDTDDPGLSLYAPRHKRRAAFVIARTDQPETLYRGARRIAEERPSTARGRARSYEPRQSDHGDDYHMRPQQRRRPPKKTAPPRRQSGFLAATAIAAFAVTAALYGYRTWMDAGSSHSGAIAAEAAPVTATGVSVDLPAVDASANSGVSQPGRGVWSDLTDLLAPGATVDGATSASRRGDGESAAAATTARPPRHDEDRARRSPVAGVGARIGNVVPIASAGVSASTNAAPPCEIGSARSSC